MKRTLIASMSLTLLLAAAAPLAVQAARDPIVPESNTGPFEQDISPSLDDVRRATAAFHWLPMALDEGFAPFALDGSDIPTCFDNDDGGMGVHYVRNVDAIADPLDPEAMVYELGADGDLRLVGVEYVVPQEFVENEAGDIVELPSVLGQDFHKHSSLPLYVLHAWIWDENPAGTFADFNPAVAACPVA